MIRARKHVDASKPRFEASRKQRDRLAHRFLAAVHDGDLQTLEQLAHDVVLHGDGGARVRAITPPYTVERRWPPRWCPGCAPPRRPAAGRWTTSRSTANPGASVFDATGKIVGVVVLDIADGHVQAVRSIINPDKLHHLEEVSP